MNNEDEFSCIEIRIKLLKTILVFTINYIKCTKRSFAALGYSNGKWTILWFIQGHIRALIPVLGKLTHMNFLVIPCILWYYSAHTCAQMCIKVSRSALGVIWPLIKRTQGIWRVGPFKALKLNIWIPIISLLGHYLVKNVVW